MFELSPEDFFHNLSMGYLSFIMVQIFFFTTFVLFTIKVWNVIGYIFEKIMDGDASSKIFVSMVIIFALVIFTMALMDKDSFLEMLYK